MNAQFFSITGLALACCGISMAAGAADLPLRLLGEPVSVKTASRVIVVGPETRYIRVNSGETVEFDIGKKKITWDFDGPQGPFELQQLVPAGSLNKNIPGYVEANPLYEGD